MSAKSRASITAHYTSPTSSQILQQPFEIPHPSASSSTPATASTTPSTNPTSSDTQIQDGKLEGAEKSAYLLALRKGLIKLQEDVNTLLTKKMAEDAQAGNGEAAVNERKEEENYGEEVDEE